MKKVWIPSIILSVFLGGCFVNPSNLQVSVITGAEEHDFKVQIADSLEERTKGLQQVAELSDEEGMWFVFDHPQNLSFWMKDTLIALDIIFVSAEMKVINVAHNVPPCSEADPEQVFCKTYVATEPAQYVLEIRGGLAEELGISSGDVVKFEDS